MQLGALLTQTSLPVEHPRLDTAAFLRQAAAHRESLLVRAERSASDEYIFLSGPPVMLG
jgi:hypothetical protein